MYVANDWDNLFEGRNIKVSPVEESRTAEFVEAKGRETDSYGEYYQGDDEIYVIFKVGDRYFKKFGYQSSYGGRTWDGGVIEVFPETKTVTVFR